MYVNFWYPLAASDELTDQPLKVRCMGLDYVLFRDSKGQAHCLSNTCIHRGGSLAGGKIHGQGGAGELLGINPNTLRYRMRKLGIPFRKHMRRE